MSWNEGDKPAIGASDTVLSAFGIKKKKKPKVRLTRQHFPLHASSSSWRKYLPSRLLQELRRLMIHLILSLFLCLDVFFLSPFTLINAVLDKLFWLFLSVIFLPRETKLNFQNMLYYFEVFLPPFHLSTFSVKPWLLGKC